MCQRKHPANPRFTIACESSKVLVIAGRTLHLGVSALAAPQPCDGLTRHVRALVLLMGCAKVERKLALYPCVMLENEQISSKNVCSLEKYLSQSWTAQALLKQNNQNQAQKERFGHFVRNK